MLAHTCEYHLRPYLSYESAYNVQGSLAEITNQRFSLKYQTFRQLAAAFISGEWTLSDATQPNKLLQQGLQCFLTVYLDNKEVLQREVEHLFDFKSYQGGCKFIHSMGE